MKSLLFLIAAGVAGFATGTAVFAFAPQADESTGALAAQLRRLEHEVARLEAQPSAHPVHDHWRRFERHLDTYERLDLSRSPSDQTARPEFGGAQWGGVMNGPTLDLLLAARVAQTVAPVYFDRVAIKGDAAQMSFYVLGAKGD